MLIIEKLYCIIRRVVVTMYIILIHKVCEACKGDGGNCNECKYNNTGSGRKNLFKRDWEKIYRESMWYDGMS